VEPSELPDDESERAAAVRRLGLIGTPPEPAYDRVVRLAAGLLDVPIAWVSIVDSDRSWCKARIGLDIAETSREASFCSHTIGDAGDVFVVEDAWLDDRFEDHPLVIGSPKIRFYAGHALRTPDGVVVGTLSVVDREPRTLSSRDRVALADLAALAEELLAQAEPVTEGLVAERSRDAADAELERQLEAAELMLEHTSDVILVLDDSAGLKFASPSFGRVLGFAADHRPEGGALALVHADDRTVARARITAAMVEGTPQHFNARVTTAAGSIRNMECTAQSLFAKRSIGGVVLIMRDVSDRHLLSQMLAFQSTHDRLTELPNRMLFQEHLVPALARARRDHRGIAVCYVDLAGFQELNDQLGYEAGDELLIDVAKRLRSSIRNGDSVARIGGDEFAVLLDPVADPHEAMRVAERLVAAASGPHSLRAGVSNCGANAGVAMSVDADDPMSIIARAARAVGRAKQSGRGNVVMAPADGAVVGIEQRF